MKSEVASSYVFGDSDGATERLRILAEVFEPSTVEFLRTAGLGAPETVIDIGCGPGHSTRLLSDVLSPRLTVGLDNSPFFLDIARRIEAPNIRFHEHDVTTVPFPVTGADMLFARFVLMHLPGFDTVVERWVSQLRPGGVLLVQESEHIHTKVEAFATYLRMVGTLLHDNANHLYMGPALAAIESDAFRHRRTAVRLIRVPSSTVARMYLLNIRAWDPTRVAAHFRPGEVRALEDELRAIGRRPDGPGIDWSVRGAVLERVA